MRRWDAEAARAASRETLKPYGFELPPHFPLLGDEELDGHRPLEEVLARAQALVCMLNAAHGASRDKVERVLDEHGLQRWVSSSERDFLDDPGDPRLLTWRVRPYYLHQGDVAQGTGHLRTPLSVGLDILEKMRGHTTGLAVPHLAVDLPGGGGKVTLQPSYLVEPAEGGHWFRNYLGERYFYPEPPEADASCPYDEVWYGPAGGDVPGAA